MIVCIKWSPLSWRRLSCQQLPFWLLIHWITFDFLSRVVSHPTRSLLFSVPQDLGVPYNSAAQNVTAEPESASIFVSNILKQSIWQWSPGVCVLTSSSDNPCVCWTLRSTALCISALLTSDTDAGPSYSLRYSLHWKNLKQLAYTFQYNRSLCPILTSLPEGIVIKSTHSRLGLLRLDSQLYSQ